MKIEMLEQCFASYLKNCEGCIVTQTNWSVSKLLFDKYSAKCIQVTEDIMDQVNKSQLQIDVFKKSTSAQFITQCEIDVVGLKYENNKNTVFLYDTAFHENSLNYKDTVATVIKKLVRAFIVGSVFFHDFDIRIGFISPKCGKGNVDKINDCLTIIEPILKKLNQNIKIDVFMNNLCADVVNDLIGQINNIADDNDLFIRAIKLLYMANGTNVSATSTANGVQAVHVKYANKDRVMQIVDYLVNKGKINSVMLSNLQDQKYSKNNFGLSGFPFLKENSLILTKDQNRFYPTIYGLHGKSYRVCSQWIPERMKLLEDWFLKVK